MSISSQLGGQRRVRLSAGELHYRETGHGDPLVFVHGVFVNGDLWRGVVPALAGTYRCITPDWPLGSHPAPMDPDADLSSPGLAQLIIELLDALDLQGVTLVGNDTGGALCQLVMARAPDRIARAVLTSCDAFEVFPPRPFGFLRVLPLVPGAAFVLAQTLRFRPFQALPLAYGWVMRDLPPDDVLTSYTAPGRDPSIRHDAKKVLRGISPSYTLEAAQELHRFEGPVLLAWGAEDKLFPRSLAERLAAALRDAQLVDVEGARTFVAEDQPEQLARAIDEFLRAHPL